MSIDNRDTQPMIRIDQNEEGETENDNDPARYFQEIAGSIEVQKSKGTLYQLDVGKNVKQILTKRAEEGDISFFAKLYDDNEEVARKFVGIFKKTGMMQFEGGSDFVAARVVLNEQGEISDKELALACLDDREEKFLKEFTKKQEEMRGFQEEARENFELQVKLEQLNLVLDFEAILKNDQDIEKGSAKDEARDRLMLKLREMKSNIDQGENMKNGKGFSETVGGLSARIKDLKSELKKIRDVKNELLDRYEELA